MSNLIDINFLVDSDVPLGKDPDKYSPTLRRYHKLLWSKPLPNGLDFNLTDTTTRVYLHHKSELGEFFLSSDSIGHTYSRRNDMSYIVNQIPPHEIEVFFHICSTVGGYIVFPSNRVDNKMTINQSRGVNYKIKDRFDLTLECIRRHYFNEDSPLSYTLEIYSDFFNLFEDFQGYVNFFLLQDLVNDDYSSIKFCTAFVSFDNSALPINVQEYRLYKKT
mgnify:FL=1|jgi:hypothetical protein|tara:strand:+ start:629 stop:1285 length:657 start_codon:yes stop_codon:yes gene_type:complete